MNDDLLEVISLKHQGNYAVHVKLSDGTEGVVDLKSELWGEVFAPLLDPSEFAKMELKWGTLTWPCGADLAPEYLRDRLLTDRERQSQVAED
jgi:hypothetical protein